MKILKLEAWYLKILLVKDTKKKKIVISMVLI